MPVQTSALMNVMLGAARKAGRSLARDFGEVANLQVSVKGPANFVTAADLRAEEIIYTELAKARPGYSFVMEERGVVEGPDKSHCWFVDPLDGTTNFLHGNPLFSVSIGLQRGDEMIAGLIYAPASGETFFAEKGKGAFLDDRRIRIAARSKLDDCLLTTGIPHRGKPNHERFLAECAHMMGLVAGIRRTGSAALDLAWTAAGRFDGYWEHGLQSWDVAAGIILVREAGGYVTDTDGEQTMLTGGGIIAGNEQIQRSIKKVLLECAAAA